MNNLGFLLMETSKQLKYQLNNALQALDITVQQWAVLQQLFVAQQRQETSNAGLIANRLGMDKPTISAIIKRMETKDLLTRQRDTSDTRKFQLNLTDKGLQLYGTAEKISQEVLTHYLHPLTASQQEQLRDLLIQLEEPNHD